MMIVDRDSTGRIASIRMYRPSNLHAHFRYGNMLDTVAPVIMRHVKYALDMPNNGPDEGGIIRTVESAEHVYRRIMELREIHQISTFSDALMTVYLTKDTTPAMIERLARSGIVRAIKSYPTDPRGTTNAGHGIPFDECNETIRAMVHWGIPLLVHAEDTHDRNGRELPHKEREAHCVMNRLWRFRDDHPGLQIVGEHASTEEMVKFVQADDSGNTVCTVTPQHLLFTCDDLRRVSWRNHLKCMPIVKTAADRDALLEFVTSGDRRAIAGDDTAPHPSAKKLVPFDAAVCGCWLPHAIALYVLAFARADALDWRFQQFMSLNGPDWWGLVPPAANDMLTIRAVEQDDMPDPTRIIGADDCIIPLGWAEGGAIDQLKIGFVAEAC